MDVMRPALVVGMLAVVVLSGCAGPTTDPLDNVTFAAGKRGPFTATRVFGEAGAYDVTGMRSRVLEAGAHGLGRTWVETLKSDVDGAAIQVGMVLPDVAAREAVPTILFPSYTFKDLARYPLRDATPGRTPAWFLIDNFVPHGFAVALVPVRGTAGNGGCLDLMGPNEKADLAKALDWVAQQPWSNGAVGTFGMSGEAVFQWELAAAGHPALKTVVPVAGFVDLFSFAVRNGTTSALGPVLPAFMWSFYSINPFGHTTARGAERQVGRSPNEHLVGSVQCPEVLRGQAQMIQSALATGERDVGGWFKARDLRGAVKENYRGSVLLVHGFDEGTVLPHNALPWAQSLGGHGVVVKQLLGNWGHFHPDALDANPRIATPRMDYAEMLLRWYSYWLRGEATVDLGPAVQVADSQDRWRNEDAWPPADAAAEAWYLGPEGSLARTQSAGTGRRVLVVEPSWANPRDRDSASCGQGCARFTTDVLTAPVRFAGLPTLRATVEPIGPGGTVTAYLYAEAHSERTRLTWAIMDLRFADGTERSSSVMPRQPLAAKMEFEPVDAVVPAGGRLVLEIAQGGVGGAETFEGTEAFMPRDAWPVELVVGREASVLTLPTIQRAEDAFFDLPWH